MNVFALAKENVTARQAAERYGLRVTRNGMACCPFHRDRHPSMKLDERYYCFGCQATGDAIDLTAHILGLSPRDAALRIIDDFGITNDLRIPGAMKQTSSTQKRSEDKTHTDHIENLLLNYLMLLRQWETEYAPQDRDGQWHPRFIEALKYKDYIAYLIDELRTRRDQERDELWEDYREEVARIEQLMGKSPAGNYPEDWTGSGKPDAAAEGRNRPKQTKLCDRADERSVSERSDPIQ